VVGIALAVYPLLDAGRLLPAVVALAAPGFGALLVAANRRATLLGPGVFLLAAEYVVVDATGRTSSASVVPYSVGLILACELVLWSAQLPRRGAVDRAVVADLLLTLLIVAVAATLLALVCVAASGVRIGGAVEPAVLGVAAAVTALALPLVLLHGEQRRGDGRNRLPSRR
jgi:hypothetical protein